jgi:hypothetical protein
MAMARDWPVVVICAGIYVHQGCILNRDGPYNAMPPANPGRYLPVVLRTAGWTVDQCAREAAKRGLDVFGLEVEGFCFMGTLADLPQMTQKLDDASCTNVPCVGAVNCVGWAMKVFSIGASPMWSTSS